MPLTFHLQTFSSWSSHLSPFWKLSSDLNSYFSFAVTEKNNGQPNLEDKFII